MKNIISISLALAMSSTIFGYAQGAAQQTVMQNLGITQQQIDSAKAFVAQLKDLSISKADLKNLAQDIKTCAATCPELQKGIMPIIYNNPDSFIYGVDVLTDNMPALTSIVQGIPDRLDNIAKLLNNISSIRSSIASAIPALGKIQAVYNITVPLIGKLGPILENKTGYSEKQIKGTLTSLKSIQGILPSDNDVKMAQAFIQKVRGYAQELAPLVISEIKTELE